MLPVFDAIRDISLLSVAIRLLMAVLCGGVIGVEREFKRRPAGFRTHILICMGAALTTMTSQYLSLVLNYHTDLARLGAQVIAGIGFIGAGTIVVNSHQRVKGLTTAAGMWTTAIAGLSIGAGFYEGGIFAVALVLSAELLFARLEYHILNNAPEVNLYMEYASRDCLDQMLMLFHNLGVRVIDLQITSSVKNDQHNACVLFSLRLNKNVNPPSLINKMLALEGVISIEEL